MLDTSDILNLNRPHMTGRIITAPKGCTSARSISVPSQGNILVLSAEDMGKNRIEIDKMMIPVLAGDTIDYAGQPIIAVFGNDTDSTEQICRQIKIDYSDVDEEKDRTEVFKEDSFKWGIKEPQGEEYKTVTTTFKETRHSETLMSCTRILAAKDEEDNVHIMAPSQWPAHMRRSIATVLDVPTSKVIIHESRFYSSQDQLLFAPSFAASIAAVAAMKTGKLMELVLPMSSTQPEIEITTTTTLDAEGKPVFQKSVARADLGAFPYYANEFIKSIFAGCNPVYKVKGLEIDVTINKSPLSPAVFFGDLGFSVALTATEKHYSKVAVQSGKIPSLWKIENCGGEIEKLRTSDLTEKLPGTIEQCTEISEFSRLFSVYSQPSLSGSTLTSYLGYRRGVGIACGEGVQGLSNEEPELHRFQAEMVLYEGGRLEVVGGVAFKRSMVDICSDIVLSILDLKRENIVFRNTDEEDKLDMGPYALSRSICFFPQAVMDGCRLIAKKLKKGEPFPIRESIGKVHKIQDQSLFNSHTCGCLALTVEIDPVLLVPKVNKVWARLSMGKVFDMVRLKHKAIRKIISAVQDVFPGYYSSFDIDLEVESDPSIMPGSVSSLLSGLTKSAATEAIELALGKPVEKMPLTADDITEAEE